MEQIRAVETSYEVDRIRARGHQVWPLIRFSLWANFQSDVAPIRARSLSVARTLELIAQFFYGFTSYFRRYEYLSISDSSERKKINGRWVDKSVDYILEHLPRTLLIELPLPKHYRKSEIQSSYIASKLPLYALEWIYATLFLRRIKIENEETIKRILADLKFDFNYHRVLRKHIAQYHVGRLLFWIYKPKGIVIQPSYTNSGFIKAFKEKGVKIIEVQHGLITSSHEAYNVFRKLDNSYFPDYFLSYGKREGDLFNSGHFLASKDRVVPVGHYYLDIINNSPRTVEEVIPEAGKFELTVSITGQNLPGVEERFVDFMIGVAELSPKVCFFYIPRNSDSAIFNIKNYPKNLVIAVGKDTYEVIRLTSFHTTIFSTCAIEALALGTPNILVNIDNLAKGHLLDILQDPKTTTFVDTVEEYVTTLNNFVPLQRDKILELNSYLIQSGYRQNVKRFIEEKVLVEGQ